MTKRCTTEEMAGWLRERDDFVILGHIHPDGDAAGATLGLWHVLTGMGKRAVVCLPGGMTQIYADLPGAQAIRDTGVALPFVPRTALAVDVSDTGRLGEAGRALFEKCPEQGVIDHHSTNAGFGQVMLLDPRAAAAGELAVEVVEAMHLKLQPEAAWCLFVAISTDTGHFSFSNTRPRTFGAAAACAAAGIDIDAITTRLYRTRSLPRTKLLGLVLADMQISPDGKIAWARLTEAMLEEAHATAADNEGIINYLQEISGVTFAILAQQRGSQTKLSLRSRAPMDVARAIALPMGGGGHACASGATVDMPLEQALQRAIALARAALDEAIS